MAELHFDTEVFLNSESWQTKLKALQTKKNVCIENCTDSECKKECSRDLDSLQEYVKNKQNLYVKKGVEYCKLECWESQDLPKCSQRCLQEYSALLEDFQKALTKKINTLVTR